LKRNKAAKTITGTTENTRILKLDLRILSNVISLTIALDNSTAIKYTVNGNHDVCLRLKENAQWIATTQPGIFSKGPQRYGTFKDAFTTG